MFPSPEDFRAHKSSSSRLHNQSIELTRRASEVENPEELIDLIMEIAGKKYRQGNRVVRFSVVVPIGNFHVWAIDSKHASPDMDQLDRHTIKQEITRLAKGRIKGQLASGCYFDIDTVLTGNHQLTFKLVFRLLKPTYPATP